MTTTVVKELDPSTRRRNRILVVILLAAMLAIMVTGVLYLQKYGFATGKEQSLYH